MDIEIPDAILIILAKAAHHMIECHEADIAAHQQGIEAGIYAKKDILRFRGRIASLQRQVKEAEQALNYLHDDLGIPLEINGE